MNFVFQFYQQTSVTVKPENGHHRLGANTRYALFYNLNYMLKGKFNGAAIDCFENFQADQCWRYFIKVENILVVSGYLLFHKRLLVVRACPRLL